MEKRCRVCRYGGGVCKTGYRQAHEKADPECRLHGSTAKGNTPMPPMRSRSPTTTPQSGEPPETGGRTAAASAPPPPRPLSEKFETRRGMILLCEPESLDRWIGQNIQKDEVSGRYKDVSMGKWLSQKLTNSYDLPCQTLAAKPHGGQNRQVRPHSGS